jgi:hypothetical protein
MLYLFILSIASTDYEDFLDNMKTYIENESDNIFNILTEDIQRTEMNISKLHIELTEQVNALTAKDKEMDDKLTMLSRLAYVAIS